MGVEQVHGADQKPMNVLLTGGSGTTKLNPEEAKLARILANVDGKAGLTPADMKKLEGMPYDQQVKYINNRLKAEGSNYRIADYYNSESGDTLRGIQRTRNGVVFNISVGGQTIYSDTQKGTGHLSVKW